MVTFDSPLDRIYQYLLISAFFLLPLTVLGNNIAIWLITILWLSSGSYLKKIQQIKSNNLAIASIIFFLIHFISLLWTTNLDWGLEILRKMLPFILVLPIFLCISKKANKNFYITAFLLAIAISEGFSYLIWFEIVPPYKYGDVVNPTPLMSHISYNPFLAFAIYLVLNKLFSNEKLSQVERAIYTFFTLTMTFNMFITGGRAGQVMFFAALVILAVQHFRSSQIKATFIALSTIILITSLAYSSSHLFQSRVDSAISDITNYNIDKNTAVGMRITFLLNSFTLFSESPLLGVGAGDFPAEYERINELNSPEVDLTVQPHNMYLLVLAQLGFLGFLSLGWIFYLQFKIAMLTRDKIIQNIGIAMPILFLIIMWSDSYLLGHYTSNLFILFSSFIYSNR